jgi:hypothetical protein
LGAHEEVLMGVVANRELTDDVVRRFSQSEQVGEVPPARESGVRLRGGAAPERVERIEGSGEVTFVHDYGSERLDLRSLYEKAKDAQWNGRTLAWDTPVDPEAENFSNSFIPHLRDPRLGQARQEARSAAAAPAHERLSPLQFPARRAGRVARHRAARLRRAQRRGEALRATQVDGRGAPRRGVRRATCARRCELTYPISPHLKQLLDAILRESRWDMKFLGMQIMVEGLALAAFGVISQTANEPLLREIVADHAR